MPSIFMNYKKSFIGIFILIIVATAYFIFTAPAIVERTLKDSFEDTGMVLNLDVRRSGLFRGFTIENLDLRTADDLPVLKASKIELNYFLPAFFAGQIGFKKILARDLEVHLIESDGVWNFAALLADSEPVEEVGELDSSEPWPEQIQLPFSVRIFGDIELDGVDFYYSSESSNTSHEAEKTSLTVKNGYLRLALITNRFRSIPLNLEAYDLIDTLSLEFGREPLEFSFYNGSNLEGNPSIRLLLDRNQKENLFFSSLNISDDLEVIRRNLRLPLEFSADYNIHYNDSNDTVYFNEFRIERGNDTYIAIEGNISEVSSTPYINLYVTQSTINLYEPDRILQALFPGSMRMSGEISMVPLFFRGYLNNLQFQMRMQLDNLNIRGPGNHFSRNFQADISGRMDLEALLYNRDNGENLAFGLFHDLIIHRLAGDYNGSYLNAHGSIRPQHPEHSDSAVALYLDVSNFRIDQFTAPDLTGALSGNVVISANAGFTDMQLEGALRLIDARYRHERSISRRNDIHINTQLILQRADALAITLENLTMNAFDEHGNQTLTLTSPANLSFGTETEISTELALNIDFDSFYRTLPRSIRFLLHDYQNFLSGQINLNSNTAIHISEDLTDILSENSIDAEGSGIEDLMINTDMQMHGGRMNIRNFRIAGFRGALNGHVEGSFSTVGDLNPHLDMNLSINRPNLFQIRDNLLIQGRLSLEASMRSNATQGRFLSDNFNLELREGNCSTLESAACRRFRIENVNIDLPFFHDHNLTDPLILSHVPPSDHTGTYGQRRTANMSVNFIAASHSPRGDYRPESYFYAGSLLPAKRPAISAFIEYRKNALAIDWLDLVIYHYRDPETGELWTESSVIQARSLFANIADGQQENMEFGGRIRIRNLDLEPYLPRTRSAYDGIISADIEFRCRDFTEILTNTNARLSVYQLSPQFSGFATRVLMPSRAVAFAVQDTLRIPAIELEMRGGLMYSSIRIQKGRFLSWVISPSDEEIRQERIPIAQFMERARTEAQDFAGAEDDI